MLGHVKQTATLELANHYNEPTWTFRKPGEADGTNINADLKAGIVNLQAMIDDKTPLTDKNAVGDIHTAAGKFIDTTYGASKSVMLNIGKYKVDLKLGEAKASADIEIKAGETLEKAAVLASGKAKLSATYSEGGKP